MGDTHRTTATARARQAPEVPTAGGRWRVRAETGGAAIFVVLVLAVVAASLALVLASLNEGDLARTDQADLGELDTGPSATVRD